MKGQPLPKNPVMAVKVHPENRPLSTIKQTMILLPDSFEKQLKMKQTPSLKKSYGRNMRNIRKIHVDYNSNNIPILFQIVVAWGSHEIR